MFAKRPRRLACSVGILGIVAVSLALGGIETASGSTARSSASHTKLTAASSFYSKFTHGKAGAAHRSKAPVTIGFFDDEGGAPAFPEAGVAAKAAVRFVNTNLGGIHGHPVRLDECFVTTSEQQGQACAQQFLAKKVRVIVEQSAPLGGQAFHQALNGAIPVIIGDPVSTADATAENSYGLTAGAFGTVPGYVNYVLKVLHAKTASLLYPSDDPTGQAVAKLFQQVLGAAGVKLTESGFSSSSPDLLPNVEASGATSSDVTLTLFPTTSQCIAGGKALKQANVTKPVISLGNCIAPAVKAAVGDYPKWTYVGINTSPYIGGDPAVDDYVDVMKAYAPAGANLGGASSWAFMSILAAVRAYDLAGGPAASAKAIGSQLKSYKGPTPMFAPTVKYGSIGGMPNLPNQQTRLYAYHGKGHWSSVTGWAGTK